MLWNDSYKKYSNLIGVSGFKAIWQGKTWTTINMEVYEEKPKENRGGSKLTKEDVILIRKRYDNGEDKNKIYKDYKNKIGEAGFKKIIKRITWKDV